MSHDSNRQRVLLTQDQANPQDKQDKQDEQDKQDKQDKQDEQDEQDKQDKQDNPKLPLPQTGCTLVIGTTTQHSVSVKYKSKCRTLAILEAVACSHNTYSDQPNNNQAVSLNNYLDDGNTFRKVLPSNRLKVKIV